MSTIELYLIKTLFGAFSETNKHQNLMRLGLSFMDTYLNMQLERHRSHVGMKVEEASGTASQPLRNILSVRERGTKGNDSDVALNLG